ncbi:VCBS repeat-containing protein, partial [Fulvivirgaceae bacterium BMA10]|nr:VCBS repeat-containing protein [Fulvivirgaceae bacterium BMA10]
MRNYFYHSIQLVWIIVISACNNALNEEDRLFTQVTPEESGIDFKNSLRETVRDNVLISEYFFNGSGVSAGDINNDGLVDLYFVSNQNKNKLYLNKGNFKFEDITESAHIGGREYAWSTGSAMIDINADGLLDIVLAQSATMRSHNTENLVFVNNGNLTFTEWSGPLGLAVSAQSTQTTFLDYDLDGDLDVFMLNHQVREPKYESFGKVLKSISKLAGDKLFRNDDGRFTDVSREAGIISNPLGYGLGATASDINQDGYPDIYVSNDFIEHDYLYINNGDGTFTESGKTALKHMSNFSMGNDVADINNDGLPDIISLDMVAEDNYGIKANMSGMDIEKFRTAVKNGFHHQYMYNTLQLNMGKNQFSELGKLAGVSSTDWSWAPLLADFDNDGYKDLFITNGFRRNFRNNDFVNFKKTRYESKKWTKEELPKLMLEYLENMPVKQIPNYMYRNEGDLTFVNKAREWGLDDPSFSNGAAYAD